MGSDELRIELDEFRTHIPRFDELSKELATEVRQLVGDLGAVTGKWGADDFGNAFANNYLPKAQQAMQEFEKVVERLAGLSKSAGTVANKLESTDESFTHALNTLQTVMDEGKQ